MMPGVRALVCLFVFVCLGIAAAPRGLAQTAPATPSNANSAKPSAKPAPKKIAKPATAASATPAAPSAEVLGKQLATLARALREGGNSASYASLAAFATRNEKNEFGARAALALGYYDLLPPHQKPEEAMSWLKKSAGDKVLREYVQYWQAQDSLALGQNQEAFEQFQSFLRDFPGSVMTESAIEQFVSVALQLGKGDAALAALAADPNTPAKVFPPAPARRGS